MKRRKIRGFLPVAAYVIDRRAGMSLPRQMSMHYYSWRTIATNERIYTLGEGQGMRSDPQFSNIFANIATRAAESAALDPDFAALLLKWPMLAQEVKGQIKALIAGRHKG